MKISKVNHTSAGVGVKESHSSGMLYMNPGENGRAILNDAAIDQRVKQAKKLYNIFCKTNDKSIWKGNTRYIPRNFWIVCKKAVQEEDRRKQLQVFRQLPQTEFKDKDGKVKYGSEFAVITSNEKKPKVPNNAWTAKLLEAGWTRSIKSDLEDEVKRCVYETLRKSFCVIKNSTGEGSQIIDLKDTIVNLVIAMADQSCFDTYMDKVSDVELSLFFDILKKDYEKEKQKKDIIKSIKNKNTKIQIVEHDGIKKLVPSSYLTEKKKPLFEFMIRYADLDDDGRKKLREEKKIFIWKYLKSGTSDGTVFSEEIENVLIEVTNASDKLEKRALCDKAIAMVDREIVNKYQDMSKLIPESDKEQGLYWLNFFSQETSKYVKQLILDNNGLRSAVSTRRLLLTDIQKHLHKYFYSYLATKYIDMGKAVYHFTEYEGNNVGPVRQEFAGGLTSFDYERITAEDDVKRDLMVYVSFAVNNLASSICDIDTLEEKDDALNYNAAVCVGAKKNILRFFGGISEWGILQEWNDNEFANAFRDHVGAIRNHILHFDANIDKDRGKNDKDLIHTMFCTEYEKLNMVYAKKYCSNNLPLFYAKNELYKLINVVLYQEQREIAAGIPAFNRLVPRSKVNMFLKEWVNKESIEALKKKEVFEKYQAAMFFVLKEIYYYGFLMNPHMLQYMDSAIDSMNKEISAISKEEQRAFQNYEKRYKDLKAVYQSVGEICEQIMLDMSMQNHDIKEVKTKNNKKNIEKKAIFQHFRMLLYKQMRKAFVMYLNEKENEKKFDFLKSPRYKEIGDLTAEDFASGISINIYKSVKDAIQNSDNSNLLSWYATAHFMSKNQLNHLCGAIHTELRYLTDVDRRAVSTGNREGNETKKKIDNYEGLLRVFEFTMNFCDQNSNNIFDYFENEDDYAKMVGHFVDFGNEPISPSYTLKEFCSDIVKQGANQQIGLYYDAENPIANRNVVRACMYGNRAWLSRDIIRKVSREDIDNYYRLLDEIRNIPENDGRRTKKEQEKVRDFQNLKNRVELTNVMVYVDIVNELYSQLLSWVYLRERDMIYMQLGFYYTKLMWGNSVEKSHKLRQIEIKDQHIEDGAVLYMIRAMYSHELPMPGEKGVRGFTNQYDEETYYSGMELFERISKEDDTFHDGMIALRNYIAHFKYFSKCDHSIEEIFGDVFSEFFSYSDNLHKSVPIVYKNLLAQYKVIVGLEIEESDSLPYFSKYNRNYKNVKWGIKKDYKISKKGREGHTNEKLIRGIDSDVLTFYVTDKQTDKYSAKKGDNANKIELPAHDDEFLENIRKIVTFKMT